MGGQEKPQRHIAQVVRDLESVADNGATGAPIFIAWGELAGEALVCLHALRQKVVRAECLLARVGIDCDLSAPTFDVEKIAADIEPLPHVLVSDNKALREQVQSLQRMRRDAVSRLGRAEDKNAEVERVLATVRDEYAALRELLDDVSAELWEYFVGEADPDGEIEEDEQFDLTENAELSYTARLLIRTGDLQASDVLLYGEAYVADESGTADEQEPQEAARRSAADVEVGSAVLAAMHQALAEVGFVEERAGRWFYKVPLRWQRTARALVAVGALEADQVVEYSV